MSISQGLSPSLKARCIRSIVASISLLYGTLWNDVSHAAGQRSTACLQAMGNEHDILAQLATFGMKSEQEKMAAKQDYCRLQTSRHDSLQALKQLGGCELYGADRLDKFILSNQAVLDKRCR